MKTKIFMIGMMVVLLLTGGANAMMGGGITPGPGGGHMGPGPGPMPGPNPGPGWGHMGGGLSSGMVGAGGMIQGMMGNTVSHGYLDVFNPIDTPDDARAAIEAFIGASNSSLQISELWEYGTVYKAELSDTNGAKAFDLIADKFTGVVMPEMGMSMMLNASYGKGLYKTSTFARNLTITPDQAKDYAQNFVDNNRLGYILGTPETYPGYYKFHTTSGGAFGMDIMVNGYNGEIWMNTILGLPVAKH
ncbi:MAG TPA: hypothetical protein VLK23_04175 [Thermodesulfobacteriota bacterium]|nr:hypothetical protein [Thermodesulfobacteriota bacterium]